MIAFRCPTCRQVLQQHRSRAGTKVVCPHCGRRLLVPEAPPARAPGRDKTVLGELLSPPVRTTLEEELPPQPLSPAEEPAGLPYPASAGEPLPSRPQRRRRLLTPSLLLLAMLTLPLPWTEVQCTGPNQQAGKAIASQTGIQVLAGGLTVRAEMEDAARRQLAPGQAGADRLDIGPAPLVAVFLVAVLIALVFALGVQPARPRAALVFAAGGSGLVALLGQIAAGFPVEQTLHRAFSNLPENMRGLALLYEVRPTPWFWLAIGATAAGLAAAVFEAAPDRHP
jgi:DNA-directed RNA polymerase subunit RPC12/RpoP